MSLEALKAFEVFTLTDIVKIILILNPGKSTSAYNMPIDLFIKKKLMNVVRNYGTPFSSNPSSSNPFSFRF